MYNKVKEMPVTTRSQIKRMKEQLRNDALEYLRIETEKKALNKIFVVNLTTEEYIICEDDAQMKRFMFELMDDYFPCGAHWERGDKIKIVPKHLNGYVASKYGLLYMDEYMENNNLYL
jgi:hypothetical protein